MKKLAIKPFLFYPIPFGFYHRHAFHQHCFGFQETATNGSVYLSYIGRISLLFAPPDLFRVQDWFENSCPVSCLFCCGALFLAYPISIEYSGWQNSSRLTDSAKSPYGSPAPGFSSRTAILANRYWLKGEVARQWIKAISLERAILLFTALLRFLCHPLVFPWQTQREKLPS